jgi:RNA:NAD 2'-phosphotransferase (TPT1/KptA family)
LRVVLKYELKLKASKLMPETARHTARAVKISVAELGWLNARLIDQEVRLTLAIAWMQERGATREEIEMIRGVE